MSVATSPPPTPATARGRPYRITAETYYRMIAAGAIPDGARLELWEGQLVEKMGKNPPHVIAQGKLNVALIRVVPAGWHVQVESPLGLGPFHVPEPDVMVVRGELDDYPAGPPTPAAVALVVEVADSSVPKDLGKMRAAYAAGGVPAYWVVNLRTRRIDTHAEPVGGDEPAYRLSRSYAPGEAVPLVFDGRQVAALDVAALLPRPAGPAN